MPASDLPHPAMKCVFYVNNNKKSGLTSWLLFGAKEFSVYNLVFGTTCVNMVQQGELQSFGHCFWVLKYSPQERPHNHVIIKLLLNNSYIPVRLTVVRRLWDVCSLNTKCHILNDQDKPTTTINYWLPFEWLWFTIELLNGGHDWIIHIHALTKPKNR